MLGLVDVAIWTRAGEPVKPRAGGPVEVKESRRWLAGAEAAQACLGETAARLIVVAGREGDLDNHLARRPAGPNLRVPARHDRARGPRTGR